MSLLVLDVPAKGVTHGEPPRISQSWAFRDESESYHPKTLCNPDGMCLKIGKLVTTGSHSHIFEYKSDTLSYAIKFFDYSASGKEMWQRELTLIAAARNVQTLFVPSAIIESHQAIAMPMMDGTLEDMYGTLDERSIIHIAYALLIALSSIYEQTGLYYTDVHPGNILFWNLKNGISFWLTDFGALCTSKESKSCAVLYQPNFGHLSNENKMLFSWLCTVMLIAGIDRAAVENICRAQQSCNSDVQQLKTFLAEMPKLMRALISAGLETIEPKNVWVRNLNTRTCLNAFRSAFFVRNKMVTTEKTKETALQSRLSFARTEKDQIESAIDREVSLNPLASTQSEDVGRYKELLKKTENRIAELEIRLGDTDTLRPTQSAQ